MSLSDIDATETESLGPSEDGTYTQAMGGTELMNKALVERVDSALLDEFHIIKSRVRKVDTNKKNILWLHDLWADPEAKHLSDPESRKRFTKLVFVSNSISFIPEKLIRRLRLLWIKYMQHALDSDTTAAWKKYFLLPLVLFDASGAEGSKSLKSSISKKLALLEIDNWDMFTVGDLTRTLPVVSTRSEERLQNLAMKYAKNGELSKSLKVLLRPRSGQDQQADYNVVEKLRSKFPAPIEDFSSEIDFRFMMRYEGLRSHKKKSQVLLET